MRARILQMTLVSKDLEGMGCGGIGDDAEKFEMPLGNPTFTSIHFMRKLLQRSGPGRGET